MPIHNLGYRRWKQKLANPIFRWWCISSSGISLAQKSRWVKRIVLVAWLPVIYWGAGFFLIGQALEGNLSIGELRNDREFSRIREELKTEFPELAAAVDEKNDLNLKIAGRVVRRQFRRIPNVDDVTAALETGDRSLAKNRIWCWLLMAFFRYPQGILILTLVGTIAPSLISSDIRSKAFLLYFSRPIGRFEYLLGKFFIPAAFMMLVTTLPAIALYIFAILMSPDLSVVWSTWDLPFRILLGTAFLVIPTVLVALMFSSMTQETRFASFAWFAFWTLGHGAWLTVVFSTAIRNNVAPFGPQVMESVEVKRWSLLSLYNNIGEAQSWVFGFSTFIEVWPGVLMLVLISVVSLLVLFRQISSPMRV